MNHTLGDSEKHRIVSNIRQNPFRLVYISCSCTWIRRLKKTIGCSHDTLLYDGVKNKDDIVMGKMRWDTTLRLDIPSSKDPFSVKDKDNVNNAFIWSHPSIHANFPQYPDLVVESLFLHRQNRRIRLRLLLFLPTVLWLSSSLPSLPSHSSHFQWFFVTRLLDWRDDDEEKWFHTEYRLFRDSSFKDQRISGLSTRIKYKYSKTIREQTFHNIIRFVV